MIFYLRSTKDLRNAQYGGLKNRGKTILMLKQQNTVIGTTAPTTTSKTVIGTTTTTNNINIGTSNKDV